MLSGSKRSALRAMVSTSIWQLGPHCLSCGGEGNDTDLSIVAKPNGRRAKIYRRDGAPPSPVRLRSGRCFYTSTLHYLAGKTEAISVWTKSLPLNNNGSPMFLQAHRQNSRRNLALPDARSPFRNRGRPLLRFLPELVTGSMGMLAAAMKSSNRRVAIGSRLASITTAVSTKLTALTWRAAASAITRA